MLGLGVRVACVDEELAAGVAALPVTASRDVSHEGGSYKSKTYIVTRPE